MRRKLTDDLACPTDKNCPLELVEFSVKGETIIEGLLVCDVCAGYYPIVEGIPVMLPDRMRDRKEDLKFLSKWRGRLPLSVIEHMKA